MAIVSFLMRVGLIFVRNTYLQDFSKTDQGSIAYSIAAGTGYLRLGFESSLFGPIYTYLWAFVLDHWGMSQGQLILQITQALGLSLASILIYPFARLYFKRSIALLAVAWMAFYPELLVLSSTMFSDSIVTFFWCLVLALYAGCLRNNRYIFLFAAAMGITGGMLVLTKGRMLPYVFVLLVALSLRERILSGTFKSYRVDKFILAALIGTFCLIAVVSPWTLRNYRVHDRLVPIESSLGLNLWIGHNDEATGTGKPTLSVSNYANGAVGKGKASVSFYKSSELQSELRSAPSEIAKDDIFRRYAWSSIRKRGLGEITLSLKKIGYAWIIDSTNTLVRKPVYWGPWGVTFVLFLIGLAVRILRERRYDVVLWLFLIGSTMTQVVFFVIPRLRYPTYPIIFLFAAQGIYFMLQKTDWAKRKAPNWEEE